ncbi:MAG: CHAT domain-containing protein [Planctomycetes bacterium]|nr:CHAT domain-containing protein [Planctomycetota bacterium]
MTVASPTIRAVFAELPGRKGPEALAALRAAGPVAEVLDRLSEEAERGAISDLSHALACTEVLVAVADASRERRSRVRRARAQALAYANRFAEAMDSLQEGIRLAEECGDEAESAQCRLMALHTLARQGKFEEAVAMGEASRDAFVRAGETLHAGRADINIGVVLRMKDDPTGAIARFDRAAAAVRSQPLILAALQSNRAEALLDLHRFAEAHGAFRAAFEAFEAAGAHRAAAIVEGNIADLCGRQGRLDEALEHFEHARRKMGEADAPGDAARLEVERAETLLSLGLATEAEQAFREALKELASRGMALEAARAREGIARALLATQRFGQACEEVLKAINELEVLGQSAGANRVRILLARAQLGGGEAAEARRTLEALSKRADLKPVERIEADALNALAIARLGEPVAARPLIRDAIARAMEIGLPILLAELHQHHAWMCEQDGDFDAALAALDAAMGTVERVRSGLRGERYRAVVSGTFAGAYEEYVRAWLDRRGDPVQALTVIERGRARALLETLGNGPVFGPAASADSQDAQLLRRRGELLAMIAATHSLAQGEGATRGPGLSPRELESQLADTELRLAATRRFAGDFAPPPSGEEVAKGVPPGCALVEYFWERDGISAIIVRDGRVRVTRRLCSAAYLSERLGSLRLQISIAASRGLDSRVSPARADAELSRLGEALLAPMWEDLRGAQMLAVVADGELASTPFHALTVNGVSMLDTCDVVTAPSASVMFMLSRPRRREGPKVAIGVSDAAAPHAEEEAVAVARAMNAERVLLGAEATVERVKAALGGAGGVHIASHARFVSHSPMQSAIKLSDGWLTARDMYDVDLAGGAVVLSACDSGRTGVSHARELLGLVRGFLSAGAGSLVLSHWLLHDATAARTLTDMYTAWYSDSTASGRPESALRQAQRRVRGVNPHVAAWGALHVVGGWKRAHT